MKLNLLSVATREKIAAEIGKYHMASRLAPKGKLRLGEVLERVQLRSLASGETKDEHHPGCLALIKGPKGYVACAVLHREKKSNWVRRTLLASSSLAGQYKKALAAIGRRKSVTGKLYELVLPFPEWKVLLFAEGRHRYVFVVASPEGTAFFSKLIFPIHEFSDLFVRAELQRFEFIHRDSAENLVSTLKSYRVLPSKNATRLRSATTSVPK